MSLQLDPRQRARVERRYGAESQVWLDDLAGRLRVVSAEWELADIVPIVPGGHSGLVFSCAYANGRAVLKALFDVEDAKRETAILDFWTEAGVTVIPTLYQTQPENGLLLLEQISPATPLSNFPDDAELERQLATLMRALHCPLTEDLFPDVSEWFQRWVKGGDFGPLLATRLISPQAIDSVLALGEDLLLSREDAVTIHGDLHHDNVLLDERKGLVAVDPYGYTSEPALDVAMWSAKRGNESQVGARARRLGQLLELDPARVDGWTRVIALDSAKMYADIAADEPDRVRHLCTYLS